jgi:uncharacterized protein YndB with AHSA1/START domain
MAEFEASRVIPVPPEQLFAVASDVQRMAAWLPAGAARATGPDTVHMTGRDGEQDARWRAQPDQRRIEWGARTGGDYAGWLQVYAFGADDGASEAKLHLSFLGDQPQTHGGSAARDVHAELERALDDLLRLVTG